MNWQLVALGDVPASPWRNGGGVTRELAVWPPDGDSWTWRMAVAEVEHDGPFSRFPGIERWFAVLSGCGVQLSIGSQAHELTCASAPLRFDGGVATDCCLLAGATQDFNLMVRSDQARARLVRLSGEFDVVLAAPKTVAVYAVDSAASVKLENTTLCVAANTLAWRSLPAGTSLQFSGPAVLWIEIELCA